MIRRIYLLSILAMVITTCTTRHQVIFPVLLAKFTEHDVDVSIQLERITAGDYFLSATFTPPDGFHLYSKDIPTGGVDGLGRPTLLELTGESHMTLLGEVVESAPAETPNFEPKELLVYPPGAVTLRLPVKLPPGNGWMDDVVKVTYMACSDGGCKAPVTGKLVPVRVPGAGTLDSQE